MGAHTLTEQQCKEALGALAAMGSQAAAADSLGLPISTFKSRLSRAKHIFGVVEEAPKADPVVTRQETRDAAYWKKRAKTAEDSIADLEHLNRELAGVLNVSVDPPKWALSEPNGKKNRSVVAGLVSDTHAGEKVDPDELDNANAYDIDTYRRRYRRLIGGFIEIGRRWASDTTNVGFLYLRGGDTTSGDIHEELRITNELTAHEQVRVAVEEECAGIEKLVEAYGRVHVASVPGNHGRTTLKPTQKLYAGTNYDTMIAKMLEDRYRGDGRVTWQTSASGDVVVPVLGWQIMLTHGDRIGSKGGQGFIGPVATIVRGLKKLRDQQSEMGRPVDIVLHGHFHTTANPGRDDLANGAMVGYNEYAHGLRARPEVPQQWMFLVHERWGMRERCPVKLEDPTPVPRPKVRVPAVMRGV